MLKKHRINASFFLTGDFYRNSRYAKLIADLKNDGNYLGAHSDKHILYVPWEKRDSTLVTREAFFEDVKGNYREMEKFGITAADAPYFLPPYEWYNNQISQWTKELGLQLVNFTPGTSSNADYTTPDMGRQYRSSDEIYRKIIEFEKNEKDGLNGFLLLSHIGVHPLRTDKFYNKLDSLITELKAKGYTFHSL